MDLNKYIVENRGQWRKFERMLDSADVRGLSHFKHVELNEFGHLYRKVSSDLVHVRSMTSNAQLTEYLNSLVSRGYAGVYSGRRFRLGAIYGFFARTFPREFRRRINYFILSTAIFFGGAVFGFLAVTFDPPSRYYLAFPFHTHTDPAEMARQALQEEQDGTQAQSAGRASAMSAFYFTNNTRVGLVAFAAGITFGIGTVFSLGIQGVMIGATTAIFHHSDAAFIFYASILPHGIMEITAILIAGAAGLMLGRALLWPGEYTMRDSLLVRGRCALTLALGTVPLFLIAGLIEGSLSWIFSVSSWLKLIVAAATGIFLVLYLGLAGATFYHRGTEDTEMK